MSNRHIENGVRTQTQVETAATSGAFRITRTGKTMARLL
jgi:hypothetical protein